MAEKPLSALDALIGTLKPNAIFGATQDGTSQGVTAEQIANFTLGNISVTQLNALLSTQIACRVLPDGSVAGAPGMAALTANWTAVGRCQITCPVGYVWVAGVAAGGNFTDHRETNSAVLSATPRILEISVKTTAGAPITVELSLVGRITEA